MKNSTLKNFKFLSLTLMFLITLSACKKDEVSTTISYLRTVNASPTLATYNIYLNGSVINSAAIPYAGSVAYTAREAGSYSLKFTTASSTENLLTKTVSLSPNMYQSFFLINKGTSLDGLTVSDDLSVPATDKAYIRFINLSPDAPAMDLIKNGATTALFTNKTYKTATAFVQVDAGSYTLDAKETSGGAVKASLTGFTFVAGYHYDVIYGGLVTPADDTQRPVNLQAVTIK
ncbi:DUF4397 domain-containing protein [Pedobacter rhizosphaerae]|uniref:DUF4397 domain-containing protein n=1 Tax=Pedobacter rhizosphaerae TaxID=390241 RepID=A0A1H9RN90_9SPHI|nr:DUF4397 domain-containing protein [Pedobacter rhizosphaerae]SER73945.1 protein of unknown function [Pedobacter rhizosphaerae]